MNKASFMDIGLGNRFLVMLIVNVQFVVQSVMFTHARVYLHKNIVIGAEH